MKQYIFGVLFLLGSIFAQTHSRYYVNQTFPKSYEISMYEDISPEGILQKSESNLTIEQNGTIVERYSNYRIDEIYRGDLNGDGYDEIVLRGFSGGAHCCFDLGIVQIRPHTPKPYRIAMANTEYVMIKDLDRDKIPEIITWDDQYSYGFGLCFACSSGVKVIANFDGTKLILRPELIKKYAKPKQIKLSPSKATLTQDGDLQLDSDKAPNVIDQILYHIYTGEAKEGAKLMRQYLHFEHPAVKKLFLLELVDSMSRSSYWDQIRRINGWREKAVCAGEGCTPPEELYGSDGVVDWFFRQN